MLQVNQILTKGCTLAVFCSFLLLTACGNKSENPATTPESKQENAAPAPVPAAAPAAAPASAGPSKFDQLLDSYETIVAEYEATAKKDPICTDDMMNLLTNVTPKLTAMSSDLQGMQAAGADAAPSAASMSRYMALTQRYTKVAEQLSKKAGTPSGC